MVLQLEDNLYKPGFGTTPAYLAGRYRECETISVAIGVINKPRGPDKLLAEQSNVPIILVGPRGVGKTVLLTYAEYQAAKRCY